MEGTVEGNRNEGQQGTGICRFLCAVSLSQTVQQSQVIVQFCVPVPLHRRKIEPGPIPELKAP